MNRAGTMLATSGHPLQRASNQPDGSSSLTLWNVETGAKVRDLLRSPKLPYRMAFSKDGRFLVANVWVSDPDDAVTVWDTTTGQRTFVLAGRYGEVAVRIPGNEHSSKHHPLFLDKLVPLYYRWSRSRWRG